MKALVTGGGGFLGLYLVEQLVARGDQVTTFCRGKYEQLDALGVETINGDIRDSVAVATACRGMDVVFHTAAVPGIWGSWKNYHGINTVGTLNIVAGCQNENVSRLIYTSSPSVVYDGQDHIDLDRDLPYPDHYLCHYPKSKALAERAVLEANGTDLVTVSLRPHLIWGPRDNHLIPRLIRRARAGRLRRVGDGTNVISTAYVENAAAAHVQVADALQQPNSKAAGRAYFINEPEPVNLWNWIDQLLQLAGLPPVKKSISKTAARRIGAICEATYWLLRISAEPPMTRFLAAQLSGSHSYSLQPAKRDFGYEPIVSTAQGLQRLEPELKRLAAAPDLKNA